MVRRSEKYKELHWKVIMPSLNNLIIWILNWKELLQMDCMYVNYDLKKSYN